MFRQIGLLELVLILLVVILILGPKRLPELGRSLAGAIAEFRRGRKDKGDEAGEGAEKE